MMRRRSFVSVLCCAMAVTVPAIGADEAALKAEMARFEGTWQLVSALNEGERVPDEVTAKVRVTIKGGKHTVRFGDEIAAKDIAFAIDPTTDPKSTTDTLPDGQLIKGIYKLEGDKLTSCVGKPGADRPKSFTSEPGSGQTLRVFERAKE